MSILQFIVKCMSLHLQVSKQVSYSLQIYVKNNSNFFLLIIILQIVRAFYNNGHDWVNRFADIK